jgi:hypothetical protein
MSNHTYKMLLSQHLISECSMTNGTTLKIFSQLDET